MDPRDLMKKKLSEKVEKDLREKFYQRGRDYLVDEIVLWDLYKIYTKNKEERYIMSYEDKKEISAAYPKLFNFEKIDHGYKITKNNIP